MPLPERGPWQRARYANPHDPRLPPWLDREFWVRVSPPVTPNEPRYAALGDGECLDGSLPEFEMHYVDDNGSLFVRAMYVELIAEFADEVVREWWPPARPLRRIEPLGNA